MLTPTTIANLKQNSDWQSVQQHIIEEADKLLDLKAIDFLDKEKSAVDGQARKLAHDTLCDILEPFFEKQQPHIDKAKSTADKTGLS